MKTFYGLNNVHSIPESLSIRHLVSELMQRELSCILLAVLRVCKAQLRGD
jgi:hypothetical protein